MKHFLLLVVLVAYFPCLYAQSAEDKAKASSMIRNAYADLRAWADTKKYQKEALELAGKALKLDPSYQTFGLRAFCFNAMKRYNDALPDFNKTIESAPLDPYYLEGRAESYWGLENWEAAQKDFLKAISLGLKNDFVIAGSGTLSNAYYGLAAVYEHNKNYAEAAEWYKKLIALDNTDWAKANLTRVIPLIPVIADINNKTIFPGCISGNCNTGEGEAVFKSLDGLIAAKYKGHFINGKRTGQGYEVDSFTRAVPSCITYYTGGYHDEKREGKGKLLKMLWNKNLNQYVKINEWDGNFVNDKLNGKNTIYTFDPNGTGDTMAISSGQYADDLLREGKIIYKKYGDYYNGTWVSDDWSRDIATVTFFPKGSTDSIKGIYNNSSFRDTSNYRYESPFKPDGKYYATRNKKAKTFPFDADGPEWLYKTFWPVEAYSTRTRVINYTAEQIEQQNKVAEEWRIRNEERERNNPIKSSKPINYPTVKIKHQCITCSGSGWVSGKGSSPRDQCTRCGGSGYVYD